MQALKIRSVLSNGLLVAEDTFEYAVINDETGKPYLGDDGQPSVWVTLRPVSPDKHRAIVRKYTERIANPRTRAMEEVTDWDKVQDAILHYAVTGWRGIVGADEKPLVCTEATRNALPANLRNQFTNRALGSESVEVEEAEFR